MSLIDRILEFRNDCIQETGELPDVPFFVFETEWVAFLKEQGSSMTEDYKKYKRYKVGGVEIYIIKETNGNFIHR